MARPRLISDEEILGTVRRAVLDEGPRFSLDTVAEELGVTAPALFKRFGSRNAMLMAALRPERPPFLDRLEAPLDGRPFADQLVGLFGEIGTWLGAAVPVMVALKGCGISSDEVDTALEEAPPVVIMRAMSRWLARVRDAGHIEVVDPETAAVAMIGALQTRAFLSHLLRRKVHARDVALDAQRFAALFLDGVTPRPRREKVNRSRPTRTSKRSA